MATIDPNGAPGTAGAPKRWSSSRCTERGGAPGTPPSAATLDFHGEELAQIKSIIAQQVLGDQEVTRLMTIPGLRLGPHADGERRCEAVARRDAS